jgi:hypothetical protein
MWKRGRVTQRATEGTTNERRREPQRAVLIGALAVFLLAQALSAIGASFAAGRASGPTIASSAAPLVERLCAEGRSGHAHVDHGPACMLCCGGRDWLAPPSRDPHAEAIRRFPAPLIAGPTFAPRLGPLARENGWASSWSSRAPPAVS